MNLSALQHVLMLIDPLLTLYIGGAVLASMLLVRYPHPARLALLGCGFLCLSSGSELFAHLWNTSSWTIGVTPDVYSIGSATISLLGMTLRGLGIGLLFAAAFADRQPVNNGGAATRE